MSDEQPEAMSEFEQAVGEWDTLTAEEQAEMLSEGVDEIRRLRGDEREFVKYEQHRIQQQEYIAELEATEKKFRVALKEVRKESADRLEEMLKLEAEVERLKEPSLQAVFDAVVLAVAADIGVDKIAAFLSQVAFNLEGNAKNNLPPLLRLTADMEDLDPDVIDAVEWK